MDGGADPGVVVGEAGLVPGATEVDVAEVPVGAVVLEDPAPMVVDDPGAVVVAPGGEKAVVGLVGTVKGGNVEGGGLEAADREVGEA
ncbi:MAG: hypothetical protein ACYCS7_12975 [Acidimicrobiales bacterium]